MCILFIAIEQHPDFPLIIAANRDEYYARPSQTMHRWPDKPQIFAGRDMQAGGTWLGINRDHQFAAVTNFRSNTAARSNACSRGNLVTKYLDNSEAFESHLITNHHTYNPFNCIYGDRKELRIWSHLEQKSSKLATGFHSISNGTMDNYWPKMSRGVDHLTRYIHSTETVTFDPLLTIMRDTVLAEVNQLPNTGLDIEREKALSSVFIREETYGTRTSTLLLFSQTKIEVAEYNYDAFGKIESDAHFIIDPSFFS